MKKNCKYLFFVLIIPLLSFSGSYVFAESTKNNTKEVVSLATVNIQDTKITSQDNNTFKISFSISNRQGVQSGIKYGIKLIKKSEKSNFTIDEKVYDEILTLPENISLKKEIDYTAPSSLEGKYTLVLVGQNKNGFPFAYNEIGEVSFVSNSKGLSIDLNSCFLSLNSDGKKYSISDTMIVSRDDNFNLNCDVSNLNNKDIKIDPLFITKYHSSYGDIVPDLNPENVSIVLKSLEKKNISLIIPIKSLESQVYNTLVSFKVDNDYTNININYLIKGVSATIFNTSIDKNSYTKGDTAKVSVNEFIYTDDNSINQNFILTAKILSNNKKCGISEDQKIETNDQKTKLDIPIKINKNCSNPEVLITIKNSDGLVIEEQSFNFKTSENVKDDNFIKIIFISLILIVILILISILIFKNKKNKLIQLPLANDQKLEDKNPPSVNLLIVFLAVTLLNFIPLNKVKADTFMIGSGDGRAYVTVGLDKSSYSSGENMKIESSISNYTYVSSGYFPNHVVNATVSGLTKDITNTNVNFVAPSSSGNYNVSFSVKENCSGYYNSRIYPPAGTCSEPNIVKWGNSSYSTNTITSSYAIGGTVTVPGDTYTLQVYSHPVSVTAGTGDTTKTMGAKLASAINSTTAAEWNSANSWRSTYGLPTARNNGQIISVTVDKQHEFAPYAEYKGTPTENYYSLSLPFTVVGEPSVSVYVNNSKTPGSITKSAALSEGVDVRWKSTNATSCVCTYVEDGITKSCGPFDGSSGIGDNVGPYNIKTSKTTTFSVKCSN